MSKIIWEIPLKQTLSVTANTLVYVRIAKNLLTNKKSPQLKCPVKNSFLGFTFCLFFEKISFFK